MIFVASRPWSNLAMQRLLLIQGLSETFAVDIRGINSHSSKIRKTTLFKLDSNAQKFLGRLGSAPIDAKAFFLSQRYLLLIALSTECFCRALIPANFQRFRRSLPTHTTDGALASCASDITDKSACQYTCSTGPKISFPGTPLSKLPVYVDIEEILTINMATASSLNISPSWEVTASSKLLPTSDDVLREVKLRDAAFNSPLMSTQP